MPLTCVCIAITMKIAIDIFISHDKLNLKFIWERSVLGRVLQRTRSRANRRCVCAKHLQGRATGWRPREELILQCESKGSLLAEFPLFEGPSVFFLLRLSTDWVKC